VIARGHSFSYAVKATLNLINTDFIKVLLKIGRKENDDEY